METVEEKLSLIGRVTKFSESTHHAPHRRCPLTIGGFARGAEHSHILGTDVTSIRLMAFFGSRSSLITAIIMLSDKGLQNVSRVGFITLLLFQLPNCPTTTAGVVSPKFEDLAPIYNPSLPFLSLPSLGSLWIIVGACAPGLNLKPPLHNRWGNCLVTQSRLAAE